jgi:amino acid permease
MSLNTFSFQPFQKLTAAQKTMSMEQISPHPSAATRVTSSLSASFNLLATVIGGGVLSLPFAYAASGLVLTTIFILAAAVMGSFSLYILCSCARRTGAVTYGDVMRCAFGRRAELALQCILATFLLFVVVAYLVLIRDINTGLFSLFHPVADEDMKKISNNVLGVSLIFCLPFMLQRDLHSLRYNCYVGFVSVLLLLLAISYRCYDANVLDLQPPYTKPFERIREESILTTSNIEDALFSFPLVALAFLSQFNMLAVHASLENPTRARVLTVINRAIIACTLVFTVFGISGYLYALGDTRDNILLNFANNDPVIFFGKIGLGVALMCGISMILLPCRDALLIIPRKITALNGAAEKGAVSPNETTPLTQSAPHSPKSYLMNAPHPNITSFIDDNEDDSFTPGRGRNLSADSAMSDEQVDESPSGTAAHVSCTLFIAGLCYVAATSCPGVSTVWSICGSSLGIMIAYILPSLCYLKIRSRKGLNRRVVGAWILLVVSSILMVVCTAQAIGRLSKGAIETKASELVDDYDDDNERRSWR